MIQLIKNSGKTAFASINISLSYKDLLTQINNYTSLLKEHSGQRIMIFSENRPEWIFALYASWKIDAIVIPVDVLSSQEDLDFIVHDSTPSAVFCSEAKSSMVKTALQHSSQAETPLIIFENVKPEISSEEIHDFSIADRGKTALILYTSGTTGNPKGVMLSFGNIETNLIAVCKDVPIFTENDRVMILLPLHHILPLVGTVVAPLYAGATTVMSSSLAAEDMISTLSKYKVSIMIGVPRLYQLIYKGLKEKINQKAIARLFLKIAGKVDSLNFSRKLFGTIHKKFGGHLKYLVCGGAPVDPVVVSFFKTIGFEILEGYGMTETAPMITFTRPGTVKPGIPGHLLPNMKIKFVDGEIAVAGSNVMQGYYKRPEETAAVLKDGWLFTGDMGFLDDEGYLHINGRKKELIVLPNGKNINPAEIEHAILQQSDIIKEAGVFLKDGILQAVIYPDNVKIAEAGITDPEKFIRWEIVDKLNKKVSPYKKILRFHITSTELPKTRLEKLKRYMLPDLAVKRKQKIQEEPTLKEFKIIKKFLEEETQQTVHPDDHLELDLAIDSLGKVSLSAFIDTAFGVDIPEHKLTEFSSVLILSEHLHNQKTRFSLENISWSQILKEKVQISLPKSIFTHNIFKHITNVFFRIFMRIKIKGLENIPETTCIIAPNHQSILDGFLVTSLFSKKLIKNTYVYAKEKHFRGKILRFLANHNNIILVDINKDLKLSIQKLAAALENGKNLLIFPEGTRSLDGKLGDFKQTFAILSHELNIPIVPVAIKGTFNVLPLGARLPRPFKRVSVEFLPPVQPQNHSYESLRNKVYNHLATHFDN